MELILLSTADWTVWWTDFRYVHRFHIDDKNCGLVAFKFPAVIRLEGMMLLLKASCDYCNFRFLLEHISHVCKDTK